MPNVIARGATSRFRHRASAAAAALLLFTTAAHAKTLRYVLRVEDRQAARLVMDLPVEHPGTLVVEAEWSGPRILTFRLARPEREGVAVRRSGPSPQRIEFDVPPEQAGPGATWRLQVRSLPQAGTVEGAVVVRTPETGMESEAAEPFAASEPPGRVPAAEPVAEVAPWRRARPAPRTSDPAVLRVFEAVERFRARVVDPDGANRPDPCGWQDDLLRFLGECLDRLEAAGSGAGRPEVATALYFRRVAATVRDVERLRASDDPILAGPPPSGPGKAREWEMLHRDALRPLEGKLDELAGQVREGFVPELERQDWPRRFAGCVTACERAFSRCAPDGPGEPADTEWDPILAAAAALDALADLTGAPRVP